MPLGALRILLVLTAPLAALSQVPFTPGNIVLSRIGDGSSSLPTVATTVAMFLDEVTPGGTSVQTIELPTSGARLMSLPAQNPLLCATTDQLGAPASVGMLTRSYNGQFLSLAGINTGVGSLFQYQALGTGDPGPNVYQWVLAMVSINAAIDTTTLITDHYGGDYWANAVSNTGTQFWFTTSGTSSGSGYTLGYAPKGYVSTSQYPNGAAVTILGTMGAKFIDISPFTGNSYMSAQHFAPTGGSGTSLATDIYTTSGMPTGAVTWAPLGLGATLTAPRGITFYSATVMFVCDFGAGLRRATLAGTTWTIDPTVYVPGSPPSDTRVIQSALSGDTLYVATPTGLYAYDVPSLSWNNGGGSIYSPQANEEIRGVALAPALPTPVPTPSPPPVVPVTLTVLENAAPGTAVGAPLGIALPPVPQVSWQIIGGAVNATSNVTVFQIFACSGQISLLNNALDAIMQPVWTLLVRAYIDDAAYSTTPQAFVNITILVLPVPRPPMLPSPALNTTVPANAAPGTALGTIAFTDRMGEAASNFTWAILSPDASQGRFAISPTTGALLVSPLAGVLGFNYAATNSYTLNFSMTNNALPSVSSTGRIVVRVVDVPLAPLLAPTAQLVSFQEVDLTGAPLVGTASTAGVQFANQNAPNSVYFTTAPRFALVNPSANVSGCPPTAPLAGTRLATTTALTSGAPLFTINATSGALSFLNLPVPSTPWASLTSFAIAGAIVRAAYSVCVNVSSPFAPHPYTTGFVIAGVASSQSSLPAVISSFAIQGAGGNTLLNAAGAPVMDTNGGGAVVFTGTGLGTGPFSAFYGNAALGLNYSAGACTVVTPGSVVSCPQGQGVGVGLTWTLLQAGAPLLATVSLVTSYTAPVVTGLAGGAGIPTLGGAVLTLSGAYFGPANSPNTRVTFGPTGVEFPCVYVSNTQTQIRCTAGPAAGAGLGFTLIVGGQAANLTSPATALLNISVAPPVITSVAATSPATTRIAALSTLGGESITLNGTNFGPASASLAVMLVGAPAAVAWPGLALTGCVHSPTSPHSSITCLTPPGVGANLSLSATVAGLSSLALTAGSTARGTGVSFAAPAVSAVTMGGDSPTSGGAQFNVRGSGFGPTSTTGIDFALYSHNASLLAAIGVSLSAVSSSAPALATALAAVLPLNPGVYATSSCVVLSDASVRCSTAPGIGRAHALLISVGGQAVVAPGAVSSLSYAAPFLAAFSAFTGPGAVPPTANTLGGQAVTLSGTNFGPSDAYTASRLAVSYTVVSGGVTFAVSPLSCNVSTPHTGITCTLAPAGGASLSWSVVLDGQGSASPSTSYSPPLIAAITQADFSSPVTSANASGGDTVLLLGSGFGPAAFDGTNTSLLTSVTYGPTGYEYAPTSAAVMSDGVIQLTLAPGTGVNLTVRVTVAGQANAVISPMLSYALPGLQAMLPSTAPTSFAAVLGLTNTQFATLVTTNLPMLDPTVRITVQLGARSLVPVLPADPLAVQNPDGSINISVPLPAEGAGVGLPVVLTCTRGSTVASSSAASTSPGVLFSYADPFIPANGVAVTRLTFNSSASSAAACPFPAGSSTWLCGSTALLLVSITGANFGANDAAPGFLADGVIRSAQLSFSGSANGSSWASVSGPGPATIFSDPSLASSPLLWRWSWSHTLIQLITTVPSASVAITLTSPPPSNGVQSAGGAYTRISPSITGLRGAVSDLPSSGGTAPLILSVVSISAPYYATVLLGGGNATCPLLVMQAGACGSTLVTASIAGSGTSLPDGINAAVFGPSSQAPGAPPGTFTLCCMPPPGQGAPVSVQVQLFSSVGDTNPATSDASSAQATISYAAPSLATVTVFSAAGDGSGVLCNPATCASDPTVAAMPYTPGGAVVVPTASTILRLSGANLGTAPMLYAGDTAVASGSGGAPGTPCPAPAALYTCYDFPSPPGEGSGRAYYASLGAFPLSLSAGGQSSAVWGMHYAPPVAAAVLPLNDGSAPSAETSSDDDGGVAPGSALGSFPTRGGVHVLVIGANFGAPNPLRNSAAPRVSLISLPASLSQSQTATVYNMTGCARLNQTAMACTLPLGAGTGLLVALTVADQTGLSAGPIFNYTAPSIQTVALNSSLPYDSASLSTTGGPEPLLGSGLPLLSGPTTGGTIVVLTGTNFGRPPNSAWAANASAAAPPSPGFCVFFSWTYRSPSSPAPLCNGLEDFVGEGEYPWGSILAWDHEKIILLVGPGAGTKDILLSARGGVSSNSAGGGGAVAPLFHFRYAAPVLVSLTPSSGGSTDGGDTLVISGFNFGPPPRNVTLPPYSPASTSLSLPLSAAPGLPTALLRIRFGPQCLSATFDGAGGRSSGLAQAAARCTAGSSTVLSQDHTRLVFQLPPGSGANLSVTVELVDLLQAASPAASPPLYTSAAGALYSYSPPMVTSFSPPTVTLFGANVSIAIRGQDFGSLSGANGSAALGLAVAVGGLPCVAPQLVVQPGYGTAISCGVPATTAAGPSTVAVTVAGQTGFASSNASRLADGTDYSPLLVVCGTGYFGRIGEPCMPCAPSIPARAAFCAGFNANATPAAVAPGLLANPANAPYSYPVALPGFYSLSVTCVATYNPDGSLANACAVTNTSTACPPAVRALFPTRDTCIVGCSPASSCLGANTCAPGYISTAPFFACKACAPNYFRTNNVCTACPASPIAQLVGLLVLLLAAGAVMYGLSRRDIYLGFASIGLNFMQTIAILATTKTAWSAPVATLLNVLSAFNLDIDLVAPECLVPGTTFTQKYIAILLLPIALCGLVLLLHGANVGFKWLAQGRTKNLNRNLPVLVSFLLSLLSLLYLYVTRTLLEVFNCAPLDPPDGYTYLQAAPIPCGISGGTQLALLPWSNIGIIVYTAGFPAFLLAHWWRKRELIMEDQLLRAKGVGDDRLTNPHAYALRKAFGRTYFTLRPDATFWGVVVLARKALLAAAIVAFNLDAVFQLAACLFVLLCAYALQVRFMPYMSPAAYDTVLAEHAQLAYTSPLHGRLRAALASVESRGRKRTRRNLLEPGQALRVADVMRAAREWAFDYNTAEAALLFAAILVILLGMLFDVAATSNEYAGSQDVVSDLLIAVVSVALLYLAGLIGGEAWLLLSAHQAAAAHRAMMRSKSGRKLAGGEGDGGAAKGASAANNKASQRTLSTMMSFRGGKAASLSPAPASGSPPGHPLRRSATEPTEQGLNPLFALGGGDAGQSRTGAPPEPEGALQSEAAALRDVLARIRGVPDPELWARVRESFLATTVMLDHTIADRNSARQELQRGAVGEATAGHRGGAAGAEGRRNMLVERLGAGQTLQPQRGGGGGRGASSNSGGAPTAASLRSLRQSQGEGAGSPAFSAAASLDGFSAARRAGHAPSAAAPRVQGRDQQ